MNKVKLFALSALVAATLTGCSRQSPQELVESAKVNIENNERQTAIIELKNAISANPSMAEARILLGRVYLSQSLFEAAEKEILKGLDLGASDSDVYPSLAKVYYYQEDYEQVINTIDRLIVSDEQTNSVLSLYRFLAALKSASSLDEIEDIPTTLQGDHLKLAQAYLEYAQTDLESAKQIASTYQNEDSEPVEKAYLNALIWRKDGDRGKANIELEKVLAEFPNYHQVRFILIELLIQENKLAEAEGHVDKLLAINDRHGQANFYKGTLAFLREDFETASTHSQLAREGNFDTTRNQVINGLSSYKLGSYERAYTSLNRASVYLPKSHSVHRFLAELQLNLGYGKDAAETLRSLEGITTEDAKLFAFAGGNMVNDGDFDLAIQQFNYANQIDKQNAEFELKEGLAKVASNRDEGINNIKKALELDESNDIAWLLLAETYINGGQYDDAFDVANRWKKTKPADGAALEGQIHKKRGDSEKALVAFEEAIAVEEHHVAANLNKLTILGNKQDYEKVFEQAKKMLDHNPEESRAGLILLKTARAQNRYDGVGELFDKLIVARPESEQVLLMKVSLLRLQGEDGQAIELLKSNMGMLQNNGLMSLGDAYLKTNDIANAKATYEQWREIDEGDARPWLRLIGLAGAREKAEDVHNMVNQALTLFPNNAELAILKVHYAIRTNQYSRAAEYLSRLKVATSSRDLPILKLYEGELALAAGESVKAEQLLNSYYLQNQNFKSARSLSIALQQNRKVDEAEAVLEKHHTQGNLREEMQLAQFFAANRRFEKAERYFSAVLEKQPNNPVVLNNLAVITTELGNYSKGLELATKATGIAPNVPQFLDTYGWALFKNNKVDEAKVSLRVALEKMPNSNATKIHLAEVEYALGNRAAAEQLLNDVESPTEDEKASILRLKQG